MQCSGHEDHASAANASGELPETVGTSRRLVPRGRWGGVGRAVLAGLLLTLASGPLRGQGTLVRDSLHSTALEGNRFGGSIEHGLQDKVPRVVPDSRAAEAALDRARIPNPVITYTGGNVDHQRERISEYLLPAAGQFFRTATASSAH